MKKQLMALLLVPTLLAGITTFSGSASAATELETIKKGVNFRTQPSMSGSTIKSFPIGTKLQLIEKSNQYWYKVKDANGKIGYISARTDLVRLNSGSTDSGSTGTSPAPSNPAPTTPTKPESGISASVASKVIEAGLKYLGTPYEFGSNRNSTKTFDCSAFVKRAYKDATGIVLPGDSRKQADYVRSVGKTTTNWKNLKKGDLMFFMSYKGSKKSDYANINKSTQRISHVGIYMGDGKILHTYSVASGGVRVDSFANTSWEYRFVIGGSVK